MLLNSTTLRTLGVSFNTAFKEGLNSVAEPTYKRVSMVVPSSTAENEYGWLGKLPRIREWVGDRVIQNLKAHSYTIKNKSFEQTLGVDRDHIEDDNIGIYSPLFQEMGRSASVFPDETIWPLLAAGFGTPCYDGQYFFDTDHPVLDENGAEATVSNTGGGAGAPWFLMDVSRAVKPVIWQERKGWDYVSLDRPDDDNVFMRKEFVYGVDGRFNAGFGLWQMAYGSKQALDADSYAAARAALTGMKGDYGRPLGLMPNLLVVGPSNEAVALKVLLAEQDAAGATNVWRGTAELLVVSWLD